MVRWWILLLARAVSGRVSSRHRTTSSAMQHLKDARLKAAAKPQELERAPRPEQPEAPAARPASPYGNRNTRGGLFAGATVGGASLADAARAKSLGVTARGGASSGSDAPSPWTLPWIASDAAKGVLAEILGPWKIGYHDGRERCDWRIVNSAHITPLHLWHHLFGGGGPLLVRGFLDARADDVALWRTFFDETLSPETLLRNHGDQSIRVTPRSSARAPPTLREWADAVWRNGSVLATVAEPHGPRPLAVWQVGPDAPEARDGRWSFATPLSTDAPRHARWPALLRPLCLDRNASEFIVNPFLGGAPFHAHGAVVNLQVKGKRLWIAAHDDDSAEVALDAVHPEDRPPRYHATPHYTHALDRLRDGRDDNATRRIMRRAKTCVQHAGDMLLLPADRAHSTLAIEPGPAISFRIEEPEDAELDALGRPTARWGARRSRECAYLARRPGGARGERRA